MERAHFPLWTSHPDRHDLELEHFATAVDRRARDVDAQQQLLAEPSKVARLDIRPGCGPDREPCRGLRLSYQLLAKVASLVVGKAIVEVASDKHPLHAD